MVLQAITYNPQNPAHAPYLSSVATIHADCITHDKTIANFMPPLSQPRILDWWIKMAEETAGEHPDRVIILCLFSGDPRSGDNVEDVETCRDVGAAGVVMLHIPTTETGTFRGWVQKLLVSPSCRQMGVGRLLMRKLEEVARYRGKSLLLLDTETGSPAELVYPKLGYVRYGVVPSYEMSPDGSLKDNTFFYKDLKKSEPL